jgi:hypothetical protein
MTAETGTLLSYAGSVTLGLTGLPLLVLLAQEPLLLRETRYWLSVACFNREIADALTITEGTVKNYVSGTLSKMGVRDRTRAVLKALNRASFEHFIYRSTCCRAGR